MDDSLFMGRGQAMRNLHRKLDRFASRQRPIPQTVAQRGALQKFRDQIGRALVGADIVDGQNVGMVECAGGASFLFEAAKAVEVAGEGSGQDLDGNVTSQARILGPIHLAHAACPKRRDDLVRAEFAAGGQGHKSLRIISFQRKRPRN